MVLVSGIAMAFNAALIALFRILSSLATLLIGSFCIAFFISFGETVWLISKISSYIIEFDMPAYPGLYPSFLVVFPYQA